MLAVFSVTNDLDGAVVAAGDLPGSLRQAIFDANVLAGADTINFGAGLTGSTILLTLGQLTVSDDVTINGLGADVLTIDAQGGSRVLNVINADADISGLTLTGGNASFGGGINSDGGDLTLTAVTISGNTATSDGGGLRHFGIASGNLSITDSTISDNVANFGGGIFAATSSDLTTTKATITASTISGNTATNGGGISVFNGLTVIEHSTITLNEATLYGDGVWNFGNSITRTEVRSSIIAGNVGNDDVFSNTFTNPFVSLGYNLIGFGNDTGSFGAAGDQTGVFDPMLDALADNGGPTQTHAISLESPAFEAGDPGFTTPPDFDQRGSGYPRVVSARIDIGAFELQAPPTLLVDTNLDENDGVFSLGNFSLREAIELANANPGADTINFSGALSGSTILLTLGQLSITDDVTVTGLGADVLTIDAQGGSRVLSIINADADISGLTLTGGNASYGGGIASYAGDLTLTAVTISGNTATSDGGGVRHRGFLSGNLSITDSTISDNVADFGGGIFVGTSAGLFTTMATITGSTISGNTATDGGGIASYTSDLTLTAVTISGNTATSDGGGLRHRGFISGNLSITDSTISDNVADFGGGIHVGTSVDLFTTTATIRGSTISGNTATDGGGIAVNTGYTEIEHSTITLNEATVDGDGVWNFGDNLTFAKFRSSIIAGNVGNDDVFRLMFTAFSSFSLGYNLIGGGNAIGTFNAAGDQTGVFDPMLGALADNGGPTQTHAQGHRIKNLTQTGVFLGNRCPMLLLFAFASNSTSKCPV